MINTTQSRITPDKDAVITVIEIAAPPERVFQALIDRDQAFQWGSSDAFEIVLWEMDVRPQGKWRFVSKELGGKNPPGLDRFDHHGEYLEVDPPRLLVQSWFANWHPDPSHPTIVRWELIPSKTGTRLTVTHSGLAPLSGAAEGYSQGWPGLVEQIRKFVEK